MGELIQFPAPEDMQGRGKSIKGDQISTRYASSELSPPIPCPFRIEGRWCLQKRLNISCQNPSKNSRDVEHQGVETTERGF
jgi:hypothetical protein